MGVAGGGGCSDEPSICGLLKIICDQEVLAVTNKTVACSPINFTALETLPTLHSEQSPWVR